MMVIVATTLIAVFGTIVGYTLGESSAASRAELRIKTADAQLQKAWRENGKLGTRIHRQKLMIKKLKLANPVPKQVQSGKQLAH